jgi:hypothetical protein
VNGEAYFSTTPQPGSETRGERRFTNNERSGQPFQRPVSVILPREQDFMYFEAVKYFFRQPVNGSVEKRTSGVVACLAIR